MTLAQIMQLALRQLDEDPQDISEYDDMFRIYANMGYQTAMADYVKPRDVREYISDENGAFEIERDVRRVVRLECESKSGHVIKDVPFVLDAMGERISTTYPDARFTAICEVLPGNMERETDTPKHLPESAHPALADYVCYRHLSNGNMAKQSKAQFYLQQFYQAMRQIRPQGMGSVKGFKHLYAVTDVRYMG